MGKRKLHAASFYQCEWTGLPMRQPYCYMPSWSPTDKLLRKGSYCNWESVAAHAQYNFDKCLIDQETHEDITRYVNNLCGKVVQAAGNVKLDAPESTHLRRFCSMLLMLFTSSNSSWLTKSGL